jgi:hypothetical protein
VVKPKHGLWRQRDSGGKSFGFHIVQYAVRSALDTLPQRIKPAEEYAQARENGLPLKDKEETIDVKFPC